MYSSIQQLVGIFHFSTPLNPALSSLPMATMLLNLTVSVLSFLNLSAVFDTYDHSFRHETLSSLGLGAIIPSSSP